jgi:acetaldehyde dehydrogenase (acetylating)
MKNGKIHVAIVGGGETGTPLLRQLLHAKFVEVTGVADLDTSAPGMQMAAEHGIATTTDFMDLVDERRAPDIVIDVTGVKQVRKSLREHMASTGNRRTAIMSEIEACLLMSLSRGSLVELKHGEQGY